MSEYTLFAGENTMRTRVPEPVVSRDHRQLVHVSIFYGYAYSMHSICKKQKSLHILKVQTSKMPSEGQTHGDSIVVVYVFMYEIDDTNHSIAYTLGLLRLSASGD